jgi:hypothetical protein
MKDGAHFGTFFLGKGVRRLGFGASAPVLGAARLAPSLHRPGRELEHLTGCGEPSALVNCLGQEL